MFIIINKLKIFFIILNKLLNNRIKNLNYNNKINITFCTFIYLIF